MIREVAEKITQRSHLIDQWYEDCLRQMGNPPPPVTSSVDLRNSGFKIAVVDTNLFPSGFNNLCETFSERGSQEFRNYFEKWHPSVRRVLIFPEEHTRNAFYWKNVAALKGILAGAGLEVEVGTASTLFHFSEEDPFPLKKVFLRSGRLQTDNFVPEAILINNDLSAGVPEYLKGLDQLLLPSPHLGWYRRKKSDHFAHYERLVGGLAPILEIDPWILTPQTTVETGVDLTDEICLKRLQETADRLLGEIQKKYRQYGINREPYLFIKNNSGTYGLGITHVHSGRELLALSRRLRNKLESAKGGIKVSEYLLQEGIPTADLHRGKPIEPVVYLIGGVAIGTFFRIHEEKTELENLNAPGMSFACLCAHKYENKDELLLVGSLLGRIASLASVCELGKA